MKWTDEAEAAVRNVPFFVRKKVRARVEKEAADENKQTITLAEVKATRKRFVSNMDSEIKGYQVETCFGQNGCANRCVSGDSLVGQIEQVLKQQDLLGFLRQHVKGDLKFHHEMRVSVAECPNACSQPQIKDIAIIAAVYPRVGENTCSLCIACVSECKEKAICLEEGFEKPAIDLGICVGCGACVRICPTKTLQGGLSGYRVQLGGRLGRHPRLARELCGLYSEQRVIELVKACVEFYKKNSRHGQRFSHLLDDKAFHDLQAMFP